MVLVGVIAVILALLILVYSRPRQHGHHHQLMDATQLRGLQQGFITWAQNNGDNYPLPSLIDKNNAAVTDIGPAKDHTANIFSLLVFNGTISTETLLSPQEVNPNIRLRDSYEYDSPKAAADPAHAVWDPALTADFTPPSRGNISYAHLLPSGPRLPLWKMLSPSTTAVLGNRGPEIASVIPHADGSTIATVANPDSFAFLIHGKPASWKGYIAFADNHVELVSGLKAGKYTDTAGKLRDDILSFDEPDDAAGTNAFLGIFTKAGPTPAAFKSIWD